MISTRSADGPTGLRDETGAAPGSEGVCGADPPAWTLHVYGRIIDPNPPAAVQGPPAVRAQAPQPLSHYVRSLTVELDPEQYPRPAGVLEWHRAQHAGRRDGHFPQTGPRSDR